ncbi:MULTISPECIES: monofunctional biosynthetic peptidoglycan transglycosylase [unclassified Sulfitobacter]|uniref:monofunctional biosynthetic peptidoglycan transglycosylase n=1 Tax=unclassified Sulfitobacter TaxID=196795 RepID=UPI0007C29338|nr:MULTISPECIES: monofunctional biosynthetic peptidoglycan transglycosylase [unclassified Sulfitobacter]KZX93872.1 monofunctional biosynthetic peptidoglycan transglycosylase [Sulfitobacter sp. HI0023]KZY26260.1 monofunctional biosynthetic peptidoglycan transglycosylase [Sulfitobacter sp. HI0040]KZZ63779.1 monofunctional biosynthetic peptidoglycan transglycosylase [Sulfitobacter sp. HI0129]
MTRRTVETRSKSKSAKPAKRPFGRRVTLWALRGVSVVFLIAVLLVVLGAIFNPPTNVYMMSEARRLGSVDQRWVSLDRISPEMRRAVVAAEDANFCRHWGFDLPAIRRAIEQGSNRGASTLSQQTVKNVYLWHGRSWPRKAMEALATPLVEAIWTKRRILEVYLNIAEFDEGVFGAEAAARHYFGIPASDLSRAQSARLAAILPDPKDRSASQPSGFVRSRAAQIADGAATISRDGRADCFES